MSSSPNRRASRSSSCVTTSTSIPVASETSRSLDGLKPSPSANSGLQSARRIRCCCSEKRGVALQLGLHHRRPRAVRARLVEAHDRAADLHQVAVGEPAAAGEPQAVDPRAVLGPAVVADRPLAGAEGELGVQARGLRVPGQRDVGLEAAADRDRVRGRLEVEDALAAVAVAEQQERDRRGPAPPGAPRCSSGVRLPSVKGDSMGRSDPTPPGRAGQVAQCVRNLHTLSSARLRYALTGESIKEGISCRSAWQSRDPGPSHADWRPSPPRGAT